MTDICFGMGDNGKCLCMKDPVCPGYDKCPFYKSKEQNDAELMKYHGTTSLRRITDTYSTQYNNTQKYEKKTVSIPNGFPEGMSVDNQKMLRLYVSGVPGGEIAKELGLSPKTVWDRISYYKRRGVIHVQYEY